MFSKSQSLWLSYASLQQTSTFHPSCWRFKYSRRRRRTTFDPPTIRRIQHQASSSSTKSPQDEDPYWPKVSPGATIPTPYEIFKQKKGEPYSKRRFYELVKVYHPDRHVVNATVPGHISRATRLERYRLIVAANDLLSDPVKRAAYDRWGAGWHGKPETVMWRHPHTNARHGWSGFHDNASAAGNATWEDWERWRGRPGRRKQAPVYFSNGTFVLLIVVFAIVGGAAELGRAKHLSKSFLQQIEEKHDRTSKELMRLRMESRNLSSQDQRVQNFLRLRGTEQKSLPASEMCINGDDRKDGHP